MLFSTLTLKLSSQIFSLSIFNHQPNAIIKFNRLHSPRLIIFIDLFAFETIAYIIRFHFESKTVHEIMYSLIFFFSIHYESTNRQFVKFERYDCDKDRNINIIIGFVSRVAEPCVWRSPNSEVLVDYDVYQCGQLGQFFYDISSVWI